MMQLIQKQQEVENKVNGLLVRINLKEKIDRMSPIDLTMIKTAEDLKFFTGKKLVIESDELDV